MISLRGWLVDCNLTVLSTPCKPTAPLNFIDNLHLHLLAEDTVYNEDTTMQQIGVNSIFYNIKSNRTDFRSLKNFHLQ